MKTFSITKNCMYAALFLSFLLRSLTSLAIAPNLLPTHGLFQDEKGNPVTGTFPMIFTIYDDNGSAIWIENHNADNAVAVEDGFFSVYLGELTKLPRSLFSNKAKKHFLTIHVNGREVSRTRLTGKPQAAEALQGETIGTLGSADIQPVIDDHCPAGKQLDGWNAVTKKPNCIPFLNIVTTGKKNDLLDLPDFLRDNAPPPQEYKAGYGLSMEEHTLSLVEADIKGALRGMCYDTVDELRDMLDYATYDHSHNWDTIQNSPDGFADLVDNDTKYTGGAGIAVDQTTLRRKGSPYGNTLMVDILGAGDFSTIQEAIDLAASTASIANPFLIMIAPGTYTEKIVTRPHVHLKGAGTDRSVITSDVANGVGLVSEATLVLVDNVSIRDLTVENTGCGDKSIALLATTENKGTSRVSDSVFRATGECSGTQALHLRGGADLDIELLSITAESSDTGLYINSQSSATIDGGTYHGAMYGVHNKGGDVSCLDVELSSTPSDSRYALYNDGGIFNIMGNSIINGNINNDSVGAHLSIMGARINRNIENGLYANGATIILDGVSLSGTLSNYGTLVANEVKGGNFFADYAGNALVNGGSFRRVDLLGIQTVFEMNNSTVTGNLGVGVDKFAKVRVSNSTVLGKISTADLKYNPGAPELGDVAISLTILGQAEKLDNVGCVGITQGLSFYETSCPL